MNDKAIKPMTILASLPYFLISSVLIYLGLYVITPIFMNRGIPFATLYLVLFQFLPFALLLITALILYQKEGNAWNIADFKSRMRLNPLNKTDWFCIIGIILCYLIIMSLLTPVINQAAQIPFFSPPDFFPAELNPNKTAVPGLVMGSDISGQYWVIVLYFLGWASNILGEEFLWRGIILPRQIKQYGPKAWIMHAILWGLWHFFWKWQLVGIIPFSFILTYAAYKRKNTWIGMIAHGTLNAIPLIMIIISVFQ